MSMPGHTRDILVELLDEVRARRDAVNRVVAEGDQRRRGHVWWWRDGAATALREVEATIEGLLRGESS